jgi:hypothetical protein
MVTSTFITGSRGGCSSGTGAVSRGRGIGAATAAVAGGVAGTGTVSGDGLAGGSDAMGFTGSLGATEAIGPSV